MRRTCIPAMRRHATTLALLAGALLCGVGSAGHAASRWGPTLPDIRLGPGQSVPRCVTPSRLNRHLQERTRDLDGAHVEFMSKINNPIGVKLGPTATGAEALALAAKLNPENVEGRLTFIVRMGADKVRNAESTGAEVLCAADNSCLMHIGGTMTRSGTEMRPVHIAEILAATEEEPAA